MPYPGPDLDPDLPQARLHCASTIISFLVLNPTAVARSRHAVTEHCYSLPGSYSSITTKVVCYYHATSFNDRQSILVNSHPGPLGTRLFCPVTHAHMHTGGGWGVGGITVVCTCCTCKAGGGKSTRIERKKKKKRGKTFPKRKKRKKLELILETCQDASRTRKSNLLFPLNRRTLSDHATSARDKRESCLLLPRLRS